MARGSVLSQLSSSSKSASHATGASIWQRRRQFASITPLSESFTKARRAFAPVLSSSPLAASCQKSLMPDVSWLGDIPSSPSAWRSPKSPKKYKRRRESVDLDKEFDEILSSDSFWATDVPGALPHHEDCLSTESGIDNEATMAATFPSAKTHDIHKIPTDSELFRAIPNSNQASVCEDKYRRDVFHLACSESFGDPRKFDTNANRVCGKLAKLKDLQRRLLDSTQRGA